MVNFKSALLLDPSLLGARDGLKRVGAADTLLAEAGARTAGQVAGGDELQLPHVMQSVPLAIAPTSRLRCFAACMRALLKPNHCASRRRRSTPLAGFHPFVLTYR